PRLPRARANSSRSRPAQPCPDARAGRPRYLPRRSRPAWPRSSPMAPSNSSPPNARRARSSPPTSRPGSDSSPCPWASRSSPGGTAVVCAVLCTFFTAFTGGSGVTILAVGGVLFPALLKEGYRDQFSLGLLTVSGSLGLLLPPSLPLILYAVVAQIPIEDLFIGGMLPGIQLTSMIASWGVREGLKSGTPTPAFRGEEALASLAAAKW